MQVYGLVGQTEEGIWPEAHVFSSPEHEVLSELL